MSTVKKEDGSLKCMMYHKKTHTSQYLSFKSNHPLIYKLGVLCKLYNRAGSMVKEQADNEK